MKHNTKFPLKGMGIVGGYGDGKIIVLGNLDKTKIKVCYNCGFPLLWTFLYDDAEYYCLRCGSCTGMLGGSKDVEETKELRAQYIVAEKVFEALKPFLIGDGCYKKDKCKKCKEGKDEYHTQHLTELEKEKNKIADEMLKDLIKN